MVPPPLRGEEVNNAKGQLSTFVSFIVLARVKREEIKDSKIECEMIDEESRRYDTTRHDARAREEDPKP
jgi:hypothetical protein